MNYDGEWTEEHKRRYDAAKAEWDASDAAITAMQGAEQVYRTLDQMDAAAQHEAEGTGVSLDAAEDRTNQQMSAFRQYAIGGISSLTEQQREFFRARTDEGRPRGDVSVATDASGGYSVPALVADVLVSKIEAHAGVLEVADVQRSATGREISFTQIDWTDTKWRAKIIGEGEAPGNQTPAFAGVKLQFDTYKTPLVAISEEFLMDTSIEGILMELDEKLMFSIGWGVNHALTANAVADDGHAVGFTVDAADSGVDASAGGIVKVLDLAKLRQKVNRRYRRDGRGTYMFNDNTMVDFISAEDGDGRPLWLPSTREGAPERIYGTPFVINDDMDDNGANKKPVAFGDFSQLKVRVAVGDTFGPVMRRFAGDVYGPKNQVAFTMSARYAGRLVNSDAVKTLGGSA